MHTGSLASSGYYTKSIDALKQHETAMTMLGQPLRVQALKLNDPRNRIDNVKAQVVSKAGMNVYLRNYIILLLFPIPCICNRNNEYHYRYLSLLVVVELLDRCILKLLT